MNDRKNKPKGGQDQARSEGRVPSPDNSADFSAISELASQVKNLNGVVTQLVEKSNDTSAPAWVAGLIESFSGLTNIVNGLSGTIEGLKATADGYEARLKALEESCGKAATQDQVAGLIGKVDVIVDEAIPGVRAQLDEIHAEIVAIRAAIESLEGYVKSLDENQALIAKNTESLAASYQSIESQLAPIAEIADGIGNLQGSLSIIIELLGNQPELFETMLDEKLLAQTNQFKAHFSRIEKASNAIISLGDLHGQLIDASNEAIGNMRSISITAKTLVSSAVSATVNNTIDLLQPRIMDMVNPAMDAIERRFTSVELVDMAKKYSTQVDAILKAHEAIGLAHDALPEYLSELTDTVKTLEGARETSLADFVGLLGDLKKGFEELSKKTGPAIDKAIKLHDSLGSIHNISNELSTNLVQNAGDVLALQFSNQIKNLNGTFMDAVVAAIGEALPVALDNYYARNNASLITPE
ncbi:hypothetical protein F3I62_18800 [Pseudomonas sp. R-28-1W-6]|uniref:hypothetical protein n=1 Tax=Pseudomonas sp. R-28-1W-6 TaxID=2650101 RepID=UPI0013654C58|nr:hypothetical protein [Pseudomonas sp. R-28-1W-6]MWV14154.1 hypothetical protein [Pseudomonas sp. R-28-1W-6]